MIRPILAILEPIIFPSARSGAFSSPPKKETVISGRDVPIATSVTPITNGEILVKREMISAFLITPLLPSKRNVRPRINSRNIDIYLL